MSAELGLIPGFPTVIPVEVAQFIKGDKGDTGDVTPEAEQARDEAQAAAIASSGSAAAAAASEVAAGASAASADSSAAMSAAASNPFPNTTDGLANTSGTGTINRFFSVPGTGTDLTILYRNDAGVAVEIGRSPSKTYLDSKIGSYSASGSLIPILVDSAGNVVLWFENGKLSASALSDLLLAAISAYVGLRNVIPTFDSSNLLVPLVVDADDNVLVWLDNGKLAASGLAPSLLEVITPEIATSVGQGQTSSDGRSLFRYRSDASKLRAGILSQPNVLLTGDSWTELTPISQAVADRLYANFGKSADGWVPVNASTNTLNGVTASLIGVWAGYDASNGVAPAFGCGIDGRSLSTVATNARYVIGNITCTEAEIFYQDVDGTFQYRAYDGPDWQTVVCGNTNTTMSVKLTGLADNTPRIVEVRTTVANTGTVWIHGLYFTREAVSGGILNKCGNAGAIAANIAMISPQIGYYAAKINPSVIGIILSVNDSRTNVTIADFKTHITTIVAAYRAAVPDVGIILIAPPQVNGTFTVPQVQFRNAMAQLATTLNCEFYSLYDEWGTFAEMNALGQFLDNVHPSVAGGQSIAGGMSIKFLNDR